MVMGLVIVKPPNPPGSRTLISPPVAVFEIAPANVLHGAVREQGLASSPTPDTHVRVACALAGAAWATNTTAAMASSFHVFRTVSLPHARPPATPVGRSDPYPRRSTPADSADTRRDRTLPPAA